MKKPKTPKLIDGKRSLMPDVPPVRYCRRCRRLLRGDAAIRKGVGRVCARRERDENRIEGEESPCEANPPLKP